MLFWSHAFKQLPMCVRDRRHIDMQIDAIKQMGR